MVAPRANALGDYLRARREQLRPDDVGLVAGARRRVPGLRREEVATLAGISSAYYLRLEQGRDTCPSAQVVEALALTLRLDRKATEYLQRLASSTGEQLSIPVDQDLLRGLVRGRFVVGAFDEFAVLESSAGADQCHQVGRVHSAPA